MRRIITAKISQGAVMARVLGVGTSDELRFGHYLEKKRTGTPRALAEYLAISLGQDPETFNPRSVTATEALGSHVLSVGGERFFVEPHTPQHNIAPSWAACSAYEGLTHR
ncbi:MAG: hypothetical protein OXR66_06185 [Candidatus Woesearchaeota archaeon]|nr:hypothetical protein [Candidatus Woesearchaeota archaeon]